jgi:hypothetical protein
LLALELSIYSVCRSSEVAGRGGRCEARRRRRVIANLCGAVVGTCHGAGGLDPATSIRKRCLLRMGFPGHARDDAGCVRYLVAQAPRPMHDILSSATGPRTAFVAGRSTAARRPRRRRCFDRFALYDLGVRVDGGGQKGVLRPAEARKAQCALEGDSGAKARGERGGGRQGADGQGGAEDILRRLAFCLGAGDARAGGGRGGRWGANALAGNSRKHAETTDVPVGCGRAGMSSASASAAGVNRGDGEQHFEPARHVPS